MASTQQVTVIVTAASSSPVAGAATSATANSAVFTPQLGRDLYLTLSGTFVGSVQLQRSTDNNVTWNNVTIAGGMVWGHYTGPCDEVVETPTDAAAKYRLTFSISSGTANYKLNQ